MTIESNLVDASIWVPILVLGFVAIAVCTDLRSRRIPNWLTVSAFLGALAFHLAVTGWTGLASSMCGFATGFGTLFVLFLIGGGGGGDVKLMGRRGSVDRCLADDPGFCRQRRICDFDHDWSAHPTQRVAENRT